MTVSRADAGSRSGTGGSARPDLVDLVQLSKRMKKVPREVARLNKQGIVPGPHYVVARQEV